MVAPSLAQLGRCEPGACGRICRKRFFEVSLEGKTIVIGGGGPAGLTAAYELLKRGSGAKVIVLEQLDILGGISKTVVYKNNRMDMGGHRFFSKNAEVNAWWEDVLPLQGAPAFDDVALGRTVPLRSGGPDPQMEDRVMLDRTRLSRILFEGKWYDYPITLSMKTLRAMGLLRVVSVVASYVKSSIFKLPESSLENFYINRFGRKLYTMFFEGYTENLWGRHPREIDAAWGAQRVKGLSIRAVLKDMLGRVLRKSDREVETSLIERFKYPKLGPGQLWDVVAERISDLGGEIITGAAVDGIHIGSAGSVESVSYTRDGERTALDVDYFISSLPLKDLVRFTDKAPENCARIAAGLPYRDYMTLGVLVKKLALENTSGIPTVGGFVPDDWVYVNDASVEMGRFQIYNNWSPYLVHDVVNTVWLGLEYFVNEDEALWALSDEEFAHFAVGEMLEMRLIENMDDVIDWHVERVPKAYPAYFDTYNQIDDLVEWLKSVPNLFCVGRNGQHRYNNIDHSMLTSFEAVGNIIAGVTDSSNVWAINTEQEYHEANAQN